MKIYSIILSLLFLCALYACENEQEQRIVGDYYWSRQMYPELRFNHEAMYQKIFSVYKDGTGYSYLPIKNKKSDNQGKFKWSVKDAISYRLEWDDRETSYIGFVKGKKNRDIMTITVYDIDNEKDILQYIGEKMTQAELIKDSLEYAELIRKKDISNLDKIKKNLSSYLALNAQIMANSIGENKPLIIDDFDGSTVSLSVDECMMLYYLLEELSTSGDSEPKKDGFVYFNNALNYLLSKHKK